ncbi:MAG: NAD(P)-binding domain-containing protein [Coriobacteriia bacterium]|nr:NAD(P)-binding domain-containing protein [Coriobacteriia bacterium]
MRISVLGTGNVGMSLATGFARIGNEVMLGTRDAAKPAVTEWLAAGDPARTAGTYEAAADFGDVVVLAIPGRLLPELITELGSARMAGKTVLDATNPIAFGPDGVTNAYGADDSGTETLQRGWPGARVVKAFNQINAADMGDPGPEPPSPLRIAGDDADAKAVIGGLGEALGWTVRDLGGIEKSRALERGVVDWIARAQAENADS